MERKSADVITPEIERKLWTLGILGLSTPLALLNAVFFYNGKSFALRGIKEQVDLRFEQIQRKGDGYNYYEHGSKNHPGGVNDKSNGKVVTIVDTPNSQDIPRENSRSVHVEDSTQSKTNRPLLPSATPFCLNWKPTLVLGNTVRQE